jgi:hypothetical protein
VLLEFIDQLRKRNRRLAHPPQPLLMNLQQPARVKCRCYAERLTCKAIFTDKILVA